MNTYLVSYYYIPLEEKDSGKSYSFKAGSMVFEAFDLGECLESANNILEQQYTKFFIEDIKHI